MVLLMIEIHYLPVHKAPHTPQGDAFTDKLHDLLGLGYKSVRSIEIRMAIGEITTVKIDRVVTQEEVDALTELLEYAKEPRE